MASSSDASALTQPVDWVFVVRGASRGFTVLLLGGVIQPWVAALFVPLGYFWLALVAIVAFAVATRPRAGVVGTLREAMTASVGSYLLVLPLVVYAVGGIPFEQAFFTVLTAVVVGAMCGAYHQRGSSRTASRAS